MKVKIVLLDCISILLDDHLQVLELEHWSIADPADDLFLAAFEKLIEQFSRFLLTYFDQTL